ncbi:hypothetical protein [Candidatus Spyradosoma sp. SGI.093]|uniref:hypothetical protein n=1 Tax=Candidatus Spyradosoma sp. SGI.093 TaxID=3420583 RepID=UPI003CFE2594
MVSIEKLSHFRCGRCGGWFSIGDAPEDRATWFCPWCGNRETHAKAPDVPAPSPRAPVPEDLPKPDSPPCP